MTLLIDLDDTLLGNDIDRFIPEYLRALSEYMGKFYPDPGELVQAILAGTQRMMANDHPYRTLKDVFDSYFYPTIDAEEEEMRANIDDFYRNVFPSLKPLTQFHPESVAFVQEAIRRGYKLAIATNPLFPYTAVAQRLEWAGLNPEEYQFSFISSYEHFHFTKPSVAYYAECLGRLGWPEGRAVMVGNDYELDIQPAKSLGMNVFAVSTPRGDVPEDLPPEIPHGPISSVIPWIDNQTPDELNSVYINQEAIQATLKSTPAVFHSFAERISPEEWNQRPQNDEWSFTEILCHLRDVEIEVNLPRINRIIKEGNPFILGYDTDVWVAERDYITQDGFAALDAFITARMETVATLESIEPDAWSKLARHSIIGPTTMLELVEIMSSHDRIHVRQAHRDIHST